MKLSSEYKLRQLDDAHFLLEDQSCRRIITMNSSAAHLWNYLEGKIFDLDIVANELVNKYSIPIDVAKKDASDLIAEWMSAQLCSSE